MKPPISFSLARIFCSLFGHRYQVSKFITAHVKEYKCTRCNEEVTDTANGPIARLTPKFRETNAYLAKIYERRSKRNRQTFPKAS